MRAYVGLGANLGDRRAAIERAVELLGEAPGVSVLRLSAVRETEPWGPVAQPPFLNAVAELEVELDPHTLLGVLLGIETRLGRVRAERWGPRVIDLDLLVVEGTVIEEPGLTLPHSHLHERRFVLEPLAELAPGLEVPGCGVVADLLAGLDAAGPRTPGSTLPT